MATLDVTVVTPSDAGVAVGDPQRACVEQVTAHCVCAV